MRIAKIGRLDVSDLQWGLLEHAALWDQNTARTADENSPHHGLSDIWARYAGEGVDGSKEHESEWYDSPLLPILKPMAKKLMELVQGTKLGGVLVTRIPPGGMCQPHSDHGWHAREYEKVAVQVRSAPLQEFHFHGQSLVTRPGDIFWFDNIHEHWVVNQSQMTRVTAIFCIKTSVFDALKELPVDHEILIPAQAVGD